MCFVGGGGHISSAQNNAYIAHSKYVLMELMKMAQPGVIKALLSVSPFEDCWERCGYNHDGK